MTDHPRLANRCTGSGPHNLNSTERSLYLAAGAALAADGVRRGGAGGLLQLAAGAWAGWNAYRGRCPLKARLCPAEAPVDAALASAVAVRSLTVNAAPEQVLAFLQHPANVGELLPWVDTIEEVAGGHYRWAIRGPAGRTLHWLLEQVADGDTLHWRTPAGSRWAVHVQASLSTPRHGRGTQVRVLLSADPFPGKAGQLFAGRLSQFADGALLTLLQRVKQQLETGEVNAQDAEANDFLFVHPANPEQPGG
ncbi:SRPBCC family protein [Pseudomonas sp. NPDC007930]|uniref:SRPBCC family protein n=1 Tax=Pseudomonas sp. NPDC007930 TaxID=3364417 RepID=UPI0036F12416